MSADQITAAEHELIEYVRGTVALVDAANQVRPGWRFATPSHLLLDCGRLFTAGPLPGWLGKMPDTFCFANAAEAAQTHGLIYAEGIAAFQSEQHLWCLPHAWCVTTDGAVADPTWDPGAGVAYLGIAITDQARWPTDNRGVLDNHQLSAPLLRDGVNPTITATLGRRLPAAV